MCKVTKKVVYEKERVGEWAMRRMPYPTRWLAYEAIGLERDGELIAATIFENCSLADVNMHIVTEGSHWLTREYLARCFAYPFVQLNLRRVTGLIPRKNERSLRFARHLGFRIEGLARHALPDDDVIITGMLREECRYVRQVPT